MSISSSKKNDLLFIVLVFLSLLVTYSFPRIASYLFFYSLIIFFFRSKFNYLWFAFLLFLTDAPGRLFPIGSPDHGLPSIDLGFYLSYQEIFIYVAVIKSLRFTNKHTNYYNTSLVLLLIYALFQLLYSFTQGTSTLLFLNSIKWLIPWSLLFTIPRLITNKEEWEGFFRLIFPLLLLSLAAQLYQLASGNALSQVFTGSAEITFNQQADSFGGGAMYDRTFDVYRLMGSFYIVLLSFIGAMFYLSSRNSTFSKNYLLGIIIVCYFSVFLSSTRGWIIAFSLILILYFLFVYRGFKPLVNLAIILLPVLLLLFQSPLFQKQFIGVANRLTSMSTVVEGDLSAGGSSARFTEYTPDLISVFKKSPVFGWGFSRTYWEKMNEHAGMANLLMQVGIVGFLIVLLFWWQLMYYPIKLSSKLAKQNPYKNSIKVLSLGFIILLVIHSTSGQHFSFLIGYYGRSFAVIIFLAFSAFFLSESKSLDYSIKPS